MTLKNLCMPSFTKEDVAAHKTKNDLWIILRGKVYDASKFRLNHPGGSKPLQKEAGKVSEAIARQLRVPRAHCRRCCRSLLTIWRLHAAYVLSSPGLSRTPPRSSRCCTEMACLRRPSKKASCLKWET